MIYEGDPNWRATIAGALIGDVAEYLGMLPDRGRPAADGFRRDSQGRIAHTNPTTGGVIRSFRMPSLCQMESEPNQS